MNKLGFGFLHLPQLENGEIDYAVLNRMVDLYLASGRDYFDSAYTYLDGKSEIAIREAVVKRYPRDSFRIATKLPGYKVKKYEDCEVFFQEELERCGVDYFDVYMLHWLNEKHYRIAQATRQFDFLKELKATGRARAIGFSYHDSADLLDEILTEHPEVDYVLIQLNYVDWESESIQSRLCYETIVKHGKKVIVMEPVKGGTLSSPTEEVCELMHRIDPLASPSSIAIRFAESQPGVDIVLSGMNSIDQILENTRERDPLTDEHKMLLEKAADIINGSTAIRCSGCGYCMKGCIKKICIPKYFKLYNEISRNPKEGWKIRPVFESLARNNGIPSDCIGCRQCENSCPQKLPITETLKKVAEIFENNN